jgi:hypothetical protein
VPNTATSTQTPLVPGTATRTQTPTAPSATPLPGNGIPAVERILPWPNPGCAALRVKLSAPAERIRVKVWTKALMLVAAGESGPAPQGWSWVPMPRDFIKDPSSGLYFITVDAWGGGGKSADAPAAKAFILR